MPESLDARVRRLELAESATDGPKLILIVGLEPGGTEPAPLRRISIDGAVLERQAGESEGDFRVRAEAFAARLKPHGIVLGMQLPDDRATQAA